MSALPGEFQNPTFSADDLKDEHLKLALQEGHDADIPSNLGTYRTEKGTDEERGEPSTEDNDPNIVSWEQPEDQDPENPLNWPEWIKWGNIGIVAFITLVTPLASSMFAPGVPEVMRELKSDSEMLATFVVSVYLLGFAFGPLLVAPLSEMYGRAPLYAICNVLFVIFSVACALAKDIGQLIGFRFLMGCAGVAPLTLGGGTIADMMPVERRGKAMALYAMGPMIGPVVGPIAGGYMVESIGWRWVYWLLAIVSGVATVLSFVLMRESYAPVILARKAARLRKATGNMALRSKYDEGITAKQLFWRSIVRPTKMLLLSPLVSILCVYTAFAYGILYFLFTTFSFVFQNLYHFTSGQIGLTYLPIGIGMIIALGVMGYFSDRVIKRRQEAGKPIKPEHRIPIPLLLPGIILYPAGIFLYGWTVQYHVHWIVPMIGTMMIGYGLLTIFMTIQTYLIDCYVMYAASAVAANTVLRSLFGGLLPLSGLKMYEKLGYGWGNSLLGFIAMAMIPVPLFFSKYGERVRTSPRYQLKL
ncbi:MFS general substrate transporter [Trichodelitschia bisporula]|uniref:MFS general substrate transporter n=1 Tax=Trichodelitschia bisporula TaxID=703511 RepID=A0A6G1IBA0_9PEZI|nr:MFS general substrate transporter [Trichodelitschia bisporula]